jgi:hypothetical protein
MAAIFRAAVTATACRRQPISLVQCCRYESCKLHKFMRSVAFCDDRHWDKAVVRAIGGECRVSDELAIRGASEIGSVTSQPVQ